MSATDELRSLLERRGIEWEAPRSAMADMRTIWSDGIWDMQADEDAEGWFEVEAFRYARSPQEAAESTSGCGTCRMEHVKGGPCYDVWRCSACGYEYAENVSEDSIVQNFCPNCGRKVKE